MSHFGDFMDGVPVKISEKYKRPPRIEVPYSVFESPLRAQNVVDTAKYCSTFENNVVAKLKELRSAKETKKNERKHRLQLVEEAKQKKLDALAVAEEEDRLKQLSVSEVSYPSTDEISALSSDEKTEKNCDITTNTDNTAVIKTTEHNYPTCSNPTDSQMNILQPIQVKPINYPEASLLDDPISDPLQNLKLNAKINRAPYSHNVETLTYRDFEQDTSSPFDNVELKTINDMELLAQVLQSQRESSISCDPIYIPNQNYATANCGSQAQIEGVTYIPNQYMTDQSMQAPSMMYASPQHYPTNGFYNPVDMENMYMQNFQYYSPNNTYPVDHYYSNITNTGEVIPNGATYIPQPYYYEYPQVPIQYQQPAYEYKNEEQSVKQIETPENVVKVQNTVVKSRSRSVPDIVKELNDEIVLAKQRANERSYNPSPTPKSVPQPSSSSGKKLEKKHRRKPEQLPNPYEKLSQPLQSMCQKIHGMGFPLDRVARICTLVGDNDKKVRDITP